MLTLLGETGSSMAILSRSRRTVSLQLYLSGGTLALSQDASLRVYGSASRDMAVKSLQLIAGTGMEEDAQTFD